MGIFGDLDANDVSSNPYWVEAGNYTALVTDGYKREAQDGRHQIVIIYTVKDEGSVYHNKNLSEFFTYYPDLTSAERESWKERAEEGETEAVEFLRQVIRNETSLKRRLCGDGKKRRGLGVEPRDLNDPDWTPKSLVNTVVDIGVVNSGDDNEYANIRWAEKAD